MPSGRTGVSCGVAAVHKRRQGGKEGSMISPERWSTFTMSKLSLRRLIFTAVNGKRDASKQTPDGGAWRSSQLVEDMEASLTD